MEQSIWSVFCRFVKESYTKRLRIVASGLFMGLISSNNIFFAGFMASLVGPLWWVIKGIGSVVLAFSTSLATAYAAYLVETHKNKKNEKRQKKNQRGSKAA